MRSNNNNDEIDFDFPPFLRVYKDGRVERLTNSKATPPSNSEDVLIVPETGVSARLYLPKITDKSEKVPVLVYYHGGGFCIETPFSPCYHNYLMVLVSKAKVIAVSIDYRRVPDSYLPVAYDDSWAALKWVSSHSTGEGPETLLNDHGDFNRVYLGGDSAGANIVHNMAIRAADLAAEPLSLNILGIALVHPYFWGVDPTDSEGIEENADKKDKFDKLWPIICPATTGCDDPLINPILDPNLSTLGCSRVLVCVAELDIFRDRGVLYYDTLGKSGWNGGSETFESKGEHHVFHLSHPCSEKAKSLMERLVCFLNQDKVV